MVFYGVNSVEESTTEKEFHPNFEYDLECHHLDFEDDQTPLVLMQKTILHITSMGNINLLSVLRRLFADWRHEPIYLHISFHFTFHLPFLLTFGTTLVVFFSALWKAIAFWGELSLDLKEKLDWLLQEDFLETDHFFMKFCFSSLSERNLGFSTTLSDLFLTLKWK